MTSVNSKRAHFKSPKRRSPYLAAVAIPCIDPHFATTCAILTPTFAIYLIAFRWCRTISIRGEGGLLVDVKNSALSVTRTGQEF
jgi:hypothetical protein